MRGDREPRSTQGAAGSGGGYVRSDRKTYIIRRVLLVVLLLLLAFAAMRTCQALVDPAESGSGAPGDTKDDAPKKDVPKKDVPEKADVPAKRPDDGLAGISPKAPLDPPTKPDDEDEKEESEDEAPSANVAETEIAETETVGTEIAGTEIAGTETVGTETAGTDAGAKAAGMVAADVTGSGENRDAARVEGTNEVAASGAKESASEPVAVVAGAVEAESPTMSEPSVGEDASSGGESASMGAGRKIAADDGTGESQSSSLEDLGPVAPEVSVTDLSVIRAERQAARQQRYSSAPSANTTATPTTEPAEVASSTIEPAYTVPDPTSIESAPVEPATVEPVSVEPVPTAPQTLAVEQPVVEEPVVEEPVVEQPVVEQPVVGEVPNVTVAGKRAGGASAGVVDGTVRAIAGGIEVEVGPGGAPLEVGAKAKGKAGKGLHQKGNKRGGALNVASVTAGGALANVGATGVSTP